MVTTEKRAVFVESGKRGARVRWGEPRVVRLDDLSAPQRRIIVALLAAVRAEQERTTEPQAA